MLHVATWTIRLGSLHISSVRVRSRRRLGAVLLAAALAGCAVAPEAGPSASDAADLQERQERACAAATAEHIGREPESVTPTWRSTTGRDTAEVEVRDGDRLHVCEIDASARPLRLLHSRV